MNDEEIRSTIAEIKAQVEAKPENKGKSADEIDEIILDGFFKAYTEGKMSKEDLEAITNALGYEFTEEFDSDEEAKSMVDDEGEGDLEGASKEELEEARTIEPGEEKEEFKEKIEDIKDKDAGLPEKAKPEEAEFEEEEEEEEEEEFESEEDERKKASEIWKMNLNK